MGDLVVLSPMRDLLILKGRRAGWSAPLATEVAEEIARLTRGELLRAEEAVYEAALRHPVPAIVVVWRALWMEIATQER